MTASGQEAIVSSIKNACKSYRALNSMMDPKGMQRIMAEYSKEVMKQEVMSEMMDSSMDDAMGRDETAEDELVAQVLQEIGVTKMGQMDNAPANEHAVGMGVQNDDMINRLNNL